VIPVLWVDAHPFCWDQDIVDNILCGAGWPTGYEFEHHTGTLPALTTWADDRVLPAGAVVVIPARYHAGDTDDINALLARLSWVLVILTSDEERLFPVAKLDHPAMRVWVQTPAAGDDVDAYLPVGPPPQTADQLEGLDQPDRSGWFFAGQVNNTRRRECVDVLRGTPGGRLVETPGFTQGLAPHAYIRALAGARVIPCPSGPHTADTFRAWEALQAGAVPVVDGRTPAGDATWYWGLVAPQLGLPIIEDWRTFPDLCTHLERRWPGVANDVQSRWQDYKRKLSERISNSIYQLSGESPDLGPVTVLVPTSPIAAHPDTSIIETTIASVRHHLPDAEILVMCDGVRPEQYEYQQRYDEYLNRLLWLSAHEWHNVLPILFGEHLHQAEMTRRTLPLVRTPLVLFVEHDAPLVTDEPIDFDALIAACRADRADVIRLHHEALVLPDHEHLMLDREPQTVEGAPLLRTVQWSQRPHLASAAFYRRVLRDHFPETHRGMIEDVMHSVAHSAWREFGPAGWDRYRLWLYSPSGGNIKRSYTLDGRGEDPKWVDS